MYDAGGVRLGKSCGDLDCVFQRFAEAHALADEMIQRFAGYEFHGDEVDAAGEIDVVNVQDVRMIESGGGLGFLHEAPLSFRISDLLRRQYLEGDETVKMNVPGLVDDPMPPSPSFDSIR